MTAFFCAWPILALLSSLPVFLLTLWLTREAEQARFAAAAEQAAHRLARDIDLTLANLRAVKGFYKGSVHVSRDEFSAFIQALRPRAVVQSLEWIPRVAATERGGIENAAREDGFAEFEFREYSAEGGSVPVEPRSEYFPIVYIEPYEGNQSYLGLDLGSDPISLDALRRARDSGEQTASRRVKLTFGQEDQYGIVVIEPIYEKTPLDLDTRIKSLVGFARGVFLVANLVRQAIPKDEFKVELRDLSAAPADRLLYPAVAVDSTSFVQNGLEHTMSLAIADRVWTVRMAPAKASALSSLPWFTAAIWISVLLILWIVRELVSSWRHSEQLAVVNHRLEMLSDQRKQAIKELERSNQELDDFAYIASHDLKEPLRAVANHAKFLLEDYESQLDQEGRKRLHRLIALSHRMQKLIGDLLHFSRLGRGELATDMISVNDVIADIEISLREALESRNAVVVRASALPDIRGHRPHITALFQNLIVNGIKYNESEKKIIEIGYVEAGCENSPSTPGHFYVRDNGIGIDERFKEDVFRIFKRLNSEQAYGEGTGAGLSFVKKIVENHGGTIWLTSSLGEGATFFFTLRTSSIPASQTLCLQAA